MKRIQRGFTLIELMIVVAIIGILAAIAIPQYQDYIARSQVGEAMTLADGLKTAIGLCLNDQGAIAGCDSNTNGIPPAVSVQGNYVAQVAVVNGTMTATMNALPKTSQLITGLTVTFVPNPLAGSIAWDCTGGTLVNPSHRPAACRA